MEISLAGVLLDKKPINLLLFQTLMFSVYIRETTRNAISARQMGNSQTPPAERKAVTPYHPLSCIAECIGLAPINIRWKRVRSVWLAVILAYNLHRDRFLSAVHSSFAFRAKMLADFHKQSMVAPNSVRHRLMSSGIAKGTPATRRTLAMHRIDALTDSSWSWVSKLNSDRIYFKDKEHHRRADVGPS